MQDRSITDMGKGGEKLTKSRDEVPGRYEVDILDDDASDGIGRRLRSGGGRGWGMRCGWMVLRLLVGGRMDDGLDVMMGMTDEGDDYWGDDRVRI